MLIIPNGIRAKRQLYDERVDDFDDETLEYYNILKKVKRTDIPAIKRFELLDKYLYVVLYQQIQAPSDLKLLYDRRIKNIRLYLDALKMVINDDCEQCPL